MPSKNNDNAKDKISVYVMSELGYIEIEGLFQQCQQSLLNSEVQKCTLIFWGDTHDYVGI